VGAKITGSPSEPEAAPSEPSQLSSPRATSRHPGSPRSTVSPEMISAAAEVLRQSGCLEEHYAAFGSVEVLAEKILITAMRARDGG